MTSTEQREKFAAYYGCFYEAHQELYQERFPTRASFVASVLEATNTSASVPSSPCISWMCDPALRWRLFSLTFADTRLWSYRSF